MQPPMNKTEYLRLFAALAGLARDLGIPTDEAEELISEILLSTLASKHVYDVDAWVTAAFTCAASQRGVGVS